jgi:hypothetical protein
MALGVTVDGRESAVAMLIALCFHQADRGGGYAAHLMKLYDDSAIVIHLIVLAEFI